MAAQTIASVRADIFMYLLQSSTLRCLQYEMETKVPIRGWVSDGYKDVTGEVSGKYTIHCRIHTKPTFSNFRFLSLKNRLIALKAGNGTGIGK